MKSITQTSFELANEKMHPVEDQWHFEVMTECGYTSETEPQKGFVRAYTYTHPTGPEMRLFTGSQADYWSSPTSSGYSSSLRAYLRKIGLLPGDHNNG